MEGKSATIYLRCHAMPSTGETFRWHPGMSSTAADVLTYLEHNLGLVPGSPLSAAMAESHIARMLLVDFHL